MSNFNPMNGYQSYPAYPQYYPQNFPVGQYPQQFGYFNPQQFCYPQNPLANYVPAPIAIPVNVQKQVTEETADSGNIIDSMFQQMRSLNTHYFNESNKEHSLNKSDVEVIKKEQKALNPHSKPFVFNTNSPKPMHFGSLALDLSKSKSTESIALKTADTVVPILEVKQQVVEEIIEKKSQVAVAVIPQVINEVALEEINVKENFPLDFEPIPQQEIKTLRTYVEYRIHKNTFGADFTEQARRKSLKLIGQKHMFKRVVLFKKTCDFLLENAKELEGYTIPCGQNHVKNQYKATRSYTPLPGRYHDKNFVEAHISIIPNLPVMHDNKFLFVKGGNVTHKGNNVELHEILNLTDRVPSLVNDIDALCEAELRDLVMVLLKEVQDGKKTPDQATHFFAGRYRQTLRCMGSACSNEIPTDREITRGIRSLERSEQSAYKGHPYFHNVKSDFNAEKYIEGMMKGIDLWVEENPKDPSSLKGTLIEKIS